MTPEIAKILDWPRETWSPEETRQVQEYRAGLHAQLFALADRAERENRNLTTEEQERFTGLQAEFDRLGGGIPAQR